MTHASVELVEAIRGVAPPKGVKSTLGASCGADASMSTVVLAYLGARTHADNGAVTCPACLVAIDAAMEASR